MDGLPFATSYQWTIPPGSSGSSTSGSITLNFATGATSGDLKVRGVNGCGASRDTTFVINVDPLPFPAGAITGPTVVCQGQTGILFSVPDIKYATLYLWSLPAGATISGGAGTNSITVDFALNADPGTISVQGQNYCGSGDLSTKSLDINLFPVPAGPITGSTTVCQGQPGLVYTVAPITGADSYLWTVPPGAVVANGSGTPSVTVDFSAGSTSGTISVYGHSEDCGNGTPSLLGITVNPLPVPAGEIHGPVNACQGQTGVIYSVDPITAATSYLWTVPPGATMVSGDGTNSVTVNFSSSASAGEIKVWGSNLLCGTGTPSSKNITVEHLPETAATITGPVTLCQATSGHAYTVPVIQYSTSYLWNYSGTGAIITNNGNSILMDLSETATSGTLTVTGHNGCGYGEVSLPFAVKVNPVPHVSIEICNPVMTHNTQPFILKGGIPMGGNYSGTGVSGTMFIPSLVPALKDTVNLKYSYTNMYSCSRSAMQTLTVYPDPVFACGGMLTDVRDNMQYPTIEIAGKCWMSANLDHGTRISGTQNQDDNCVAEKYCYGDLAANCSRYGGLYQWNEIMQYNHSGTVQGLCPPAWHVPSEAEWSQLFNHYVTSGYAGNPLKYTGYSGFNALLAGFIGSNKRWEMEGFATMLWSSEPVGNIKARAHGLNEPNPSISFYPGSRVNGFSVRCVKD